MPEATVIVQPSRPIGTISPRIYGHFAEHLARCCYDGLWVGRDCLDIPRTGGFRDDVVAALRALPVPMLRWPGGCYADHYHWRDGIGPPATRPRRLGMTCGLQVLDDNSLGTHEFLNLCQMLGAEPYLAGNVGTGSPQELCDWVEYCNTPIDTDLKRLRARHGAMEPFGVRLWGVGNENWGCGGNDDVRTYAAAYRRYATMLLHVDPTAELVACGFDDAWNAEFLATLGDKVHLVDHLSIHHYWCAGGPETEFTETRYYAALAEARQAERFVERTAAIIAGVNRKKPIGIALDEWGVWHPEARPWVRGVVSPRSPVTFEQANTLRDALAAALALAGFHRQCQVLSMANLAQIVNVLQAPVMTRGAAMWLTPTYHVLKMHTPHIGATALESELRDAPRLPDGSAALSVTSSRREDGSATVSLVNLHRRQPFGVKIMGVSTPVASARLLTADNPAAENSAAQPDRVKPVNVAVSADDAAGCALTLPPHAVASVTFTPSSRSSIAPVA